MRKKILLLGSGELGKELGNSSTKARSIYYCC
jgi:formate-dependent phosphoribosylglycinamide formyltransferase (GAR transformylase)